VEQRIHDEFGRAAATCALIADAMNDPTAENARSIAEHGRQLRRVRRSVDAELVTITACLTPVTSDLRLALALIQLARYGSPIANQFELISEQLVDIDPAVRPPGDMGQAVVDQHASRLAASSRCS